jgi:hypothetical protein
MQESSSHSVTLLLVDASAGKQQAINALFPIVYAERSGPPSLFLRAGVHYSSKECKICVCIVYFAYVDSARC